MSPSGGRAGSSLVLALSSRLYVLEITPAAGSTVGQAGCVVLFIHEGDWPGSTAYGLPLVSGDMKN